jgi:branched-chain amino acid transport system permease protein
VHKFGHVPELLITFGLSYLLLELVQLVWGRSPSTTGCRRPAGPAVHLFGTNFPKSTAPSS